MKCFFKILCAAVSALTVQAFAQLGLDTHPLGASSILEAKQIQFESAVLADSTVQTDPHVFGVANNKLRVGLGENLEAQTELISYFVETRNQDMTESSLKLGGGTFGLKWNFLKDSDKFESSLSGSIGLVSVGTLTTQFTVRNPWTFTLGSHVFMRSQIGFTYAKFDNPNAINNSNMVSDGLHSTQTFQSLAIHREFLDNLSGYVGFEAHQLGTYAHANPLGGLFWQMNESSLIELGMIGIHPRAMLAIRY